MNVTEDWQLCFKIKPAFVRLVRGEKENVDTREGITWAYAETDFVMCGQGKDGKPNEIDIYPIKHDAFNESYRIEEEVRRKELTLLCGHTGKHAEFLFDVSRRFRTSDATVAQRIEDYDLNPQRHQTFLKVVGDERDEFGVWIIREITCTSCDESMSPSTALSHLVTEDKKYQATVGDTKND